MNHRGMMLDQVLTIKLNGLNRENQLFYLTLLIGSNILIFIFSILFISSVSFACGCPLLGFEILLAIFISIIFNWWVISKFFEVHKLKAFGILCFIVLLIFLISINFSGRFYDLSYDGQTYHQEAIIQLVNGWNPFYEDLSIESTSHYVLLNNYSKGAWIIAAALYKITDRIEKSKTFNLLLIFASLFISFSAFLCFTKITVKTALILAILVSFNPVSVYQSLSFYVDGQLSSLLVSLASLSYLLFSRWGNIIKILFVINISLISNIKFTGLIYASLIVLGLLICFFLYKKIKLCLKVIILSIISFFLAFCFIGFSPYIKNTFRHGHPFYPLFGSGSIDIVTYNLPGNFLEKNRFEKLILSAFSKSENVIQPAVSKLKWPFTVYKSELKSFGFPDTRVGGWGPLFGGIIIISIIILFLGIYFDFQKTKIAVGVSLLIIISVVINPESWWARYSPQFWMIPTFFIILSKYINKRLLKYLGYFLVFVMALNIILISICYIQWQCHVNGLLKKQLLSILNNQNQVLVNFGDFRSNRVRLNELGIKYKEIIESECIKYIQLISSNTKICIEKY